MNISCSNQDPCPVILDSKCVIYEGENLLYIGVNTNDNYRTALQNINDAIGDLVLSSGINQLTGDVLAVGPGVTPATLATVNSTPGQYGSSTAIPKVTVDGKGRVTAISTDPVFIPSGALNFIGDVTGSGNTGSDTTLTLKTVNSNVYTTNNFLKFAVNAKGLITSATPVSSSDIISTLGYTPYNSTNPAGYISGITGPMVVTALGYTPYDASNPSGYISTINGIVAGGELTGTYPNPTLVNAAVTGKVLTGLNLTPGGTILSTDSILEAFGKLQNQLSALLGGVSYQGTWNATTNIPTIVSNVGTKGHYYIVSVAGNTDINGISDWRVGDWIIFNGAAWDKVDNTDAVSSVNGFTGAVSLTTDNIPEALTNQYFTTSRARLALSGGTGINYDNSTGIITNTITQYTDALARQSISVTNVGTSGAATYNSSTGVLNIPNYTTDLSGYVPYSGANQAVNLGNYNLTVKEISIGTGAKDNTNIAIGRNVMSYLSSGTGNVAVGVDALYFNGADGNVVIGYEAGYYSNQGGNVTIGYQAGKGNGPGSNSVAIGYQAMTNNTNGSSNIAIGYQAGSQLNGSNNTIIGGYVGSTMSNNVILADGVGNIRYIYDGTNNNFYQKVIFGSTLGNGTYTYTLPGATGTLALTSDLGSYVPYTGATQNVNLGVYNIELGAVLTNKTANGGLLMKQNTTISAEVSGTNYTSIKPFNARYLYFDFGQPTSYKSFRIDANGLTNATLRTYTIPDADGTIALTSNLSSYLPLTGGTLTGALSGTSATFSDQLAIGGQSIIYGGLSGLYALQNGNSSYYSFDQESGIVGNAYYNSGWKYKTTNRASRYIANIGTHTFEYAVSGTANAALTWLPALTISNTGAATFSSSVTAGGSIESTGAYFLNGNAYFGKASSIISGGSANDGAIMVSGSNNLLFGIALSEKMRITSSGNVGIGTSSPATKLNLYDASQSVLRIEGSTGVSHWGANSSAAYLTTESAIPLLFITNTSERMRITSGGNLLVGRTTIGSYNANICVGSATTFTADFMNAAGTTLQLWGTGSASTGWNGTDSATYMGKNTSTNRSLSAAGTLNASGADYAEYMTKAVEDNINKGDIVGVDSNGLLTNIFSNAISFVIKSTNPSYVGGDDWGVGIEDKDELELAKQKVDRIAFSGQVPCNVYNAKVGDYIIPIELNGKISGQAISNPTFEQYQISVGKVWKIMNDGRAWVAVKIG